MNELIQEALAWYNLPLTFLFLLVILYWGMVCLGIFDIESFDVDVETDLDADIEFDAEGDLDADVEADAGAAEGGSFLVGFMRFLNVGDVPLMIVLSVLITSTWMFSMALNHYLNTTARFFIGLAIIGGGFFVSLFITKVLTLPVKLLLTNLNKTYDEHVPVVGRVCKVKTGEVTESYGQAEITTKGASLLINVRSAAGSEPLARGDQALIVSHDKDTAWYEIRKISDQEI